MRIPYVLGRCVVLVGVAVASVNFPFHFSGIPVPGRRVSALQQFQLYVNSCQMSSSAKEIVEHLSQIIENVDAEQIAEKMQRNYYFMVDDLDVEKMMGRWITVVDSPSVHGERCVVTYYTALHSGGKFSTFSTTQYSRNGEDVRVLHGMGEKVGPDPGSLLIITGHPADHCPYFPVRVGPVNGDGKYEYLVLTQALKHPTEDCLDPYMNKHPQRLRRVPLGSCGAGTPPMRSGRGRERPECVTHPSPLTVVLVRDIGRYEGGYRAEIKDYLDRYGYMNPPTALNSPLHFVNTTNCVTANEYYLNVGEEIGQ